MIAGILFIAFMVTGSTIAIYERWKNLNNSGKRIYRQFFKLSAVVSIVITIQLIARAVRNAFAEGQFNTYLFDEFTIIALILLFAYAVATLFCHRQLRSRTVEEPIKKVALAGYSFVATTQILFGGLCAIAIAAVVISIGSNGQFAN